MAYTVASCSGIPSFSQSVFAYEITTAVAKVILEREYERTGYLISNAYQDVLGHSSLHATQLCLLSYYLLQQIMVRDLVTAENCS
jgi:hypothetical protein